ncbi:winged helix-turn-helix transcriptional regulator [Candidatus Villigracilis proximus]|uniref:winged helix-turn-helix transcriptional regulator n=1 Tax=Candidatus Villigracilis proximus TaxID=3140683 RepID=UPI0031E942C4
MQTQKYPPNVLNEMCPSRQTLEIIADKWATLVLVSIARGINRHNRMLREIGGISKKCSHKLCVNLNKMELSTARYIPLSRQWWNTPSPPLEKS